MSDSVNDWLEWLLGLEHISLDEASALSLRWQLPMAAWLIVLVTAGMIFYVVSVYRREGGRRWVRIGLAGLRSLLVLVLVLTICQPVLILQRTKVDRSHVAVLVDASASMGRADRYYNSTEARAAASAAGLAVPPGDAELPTQVIEQLASGPSRFDLVLAAASAQDGAFFKRLAARHRVDVYTFSNRAVPVAVITTPAEGKAAIDALSAVTPDGTVTDLAGSIGDVLARTRGTRLAAIIIASDGVSTVRSDLRTAGQAAQRRHVPIHSVLLGSSIAPRDVAVGPLFVEDTVFVKDLIAIRARVSGHGFDEAIKVAVSLHEEGESAPLATETITIGGDILEASVELRTQPRKGGKVRYEVSVVPRPDEANVSNNVATVDVMVIDDKIRVLYVDDEPRFEYRYLKNTLLREETVVSSCLLLSADASFPQEGDEPITRFPESPEELARYDVILFGDVNLESGWITEAQLHMVQAFVGEQGGGFGVIAGPRQGLAGFRASPIDVLLPVKLDEQYVGGDARGLMSVYRPTLTAEGQASPIFRLELDAAENLATFEQLPGMYWLARTLGPKPGAEVLARHPTLETLNGAAPVVVVGRYGAGRVFFQAMDETWRWRESTGEGYFDAYWLGVVRYLARSKTIGRDRRFELSAEPARAEYGQTVTVRLTVLDAGLIERLADRMTVRVIDPTGLPAESVTLTRVQPGSKWFEGSFIGESNGDYALSVRPTALQPGERAPATTVTVATSDLEGRVLRADHDALRQLSAMTEGGRAVLVDELASLADGIEDRSVAIADDLAEPLWDTKLVLLLFVLIITTEWVVRKSMDLV